MTDELASAIRALGIEDKTRHLISASEYSTDFIQRTRQQLDEATVGQGMGSCDFASVVAFGSVARREMTDASDFDYLVIVGKLPDHHLEPQRLLETADRIASTTKRPGSSGLFGSCVAAFDLVERVGLQEDTNHNHTRRMLYLEESVSLSNKTLYQDVLRLIIQRYLDDRIGEIGTSRVPRFLVNDVVRYWRTVAVDYQAKILTRVGEAEWGLRYLKLIFSRKTTYASMLAVLLTCDEDHQATPENLAAALSMPSLARLASLHDRLGDEGKEALAKLLENQDWFIARNGDESWRKTVNQVTGRQNKEDVAEFRKARGRARELHDSLTTIFLRDPLMADRSREYLLF